jgi:mannose-1-phosphate guanylyltransferase
MTGAILPAPEYDIHSLPSALKWGILVVLNTMSTVYAVIMAGGRGERFWPLSTEERPKPFVPLTGPVTLLQETVARIRPLFPLERIFIALGEKHREIASSQVPEVPPANFIVEPLGRDTAGCIGLSALYLAQRDPGAIMLALPADDSNGDRESRRIHGDRFRHQAGSPGNRVWLRPGREAGRAGGCLARPSLCGKA